VRQVWRVAWYRFRATFVRRLGGYVAIVVLIGLTGGIALGSIAGARRTQSSYPKFLASTNPSDMTVSLFNSYGGAVPELQAKIARLPGVKRATSVYLPQVTFANANGTPDVHRISSQVFMIASPDGEFLDQDRLGVVHGRLARPNDANEAVMNASAARQLGVRLGEVMPLGLFTSHSSPARLRLNVKVVGIVVFNSQVVQDDIDAAYGFVVLTPAFLREATRVAPSAVSPVSNGLELDHGARDVPTVERELVGLFPRGAAYEFHATGPVVTEVESAIKPESIALGAFGVIAALVALVIAAQAVSRQLRSADDDRRLLRALGAGPAVTAADGLIGVIGSIVVGSLLAVGVAVALSPLTPLGPVKAVYPASGIAFDWSVLGVGFAGLVVVLSAIAFAIAYRHAPHRLARRAQLTRARGSRAARAAANAGVPTPAVTGIRFAFEPGTGRSAVPVRSALVGTMLAVALVVATLTFASGLHTLVSHPPLYGWNWNYMINPSQEVPPPTLKLLDHDHDVAAWSGVEYEVADINGQSIPVLLAPPRSAVSEPILTGHGLDANNQIVIGATTLAGLHEHVGNTVVVSYGKPADAPAYVPPTRLRIVGTATFPAVGFDSFVADHTSMGTGALLPTDLQPEAFRKAQQGPDPLLNGPDLVFVRLRVGVNATAGRADLQRIADVTDKDLNADPKAAGNNVTIVPVQRPAQIVNYRTVGGAPILLATGLAVGAILALALTLMTSVRRRRRDLALLKTLGFTRRQLAATVASQASIVALLGTVVGVPVGIAVGRSLWTRFAHDIAAVPKPTVPTLSVAIVAIGALVLANVVAAIPARQAARTPSAVLLHEE
jgi:hypothetical protein